MQYLNKLKRESDLILMSGEHVEVYLLEDAINEADIGEWAVHFRQNYCLDSQIDILRRGTSLSRKEYLLKLVFPEEKPSSDDRRGPSTRSGDFAELLIADYLTYCENYFVPKDRYKVKFNRNSSTQGTDVIGLKKQIGIDSPNDEMIVVEVKASAAATRPLNRLQDAVNDSKKDYVRKGETLNAIKQRALDKDDLTTVDYVERFQDEVEKPYVMKYGAAAVQNLDSYDENTVKTTVLNDSTQRLIVIKRNQLMVLVNKIYDTAADC